MDRKIICLIVTLGLFLGCAESVQQGRESTVPPSYSSLPATVGGENDLIFNPTEVEAALPEMRDLPIPSILKKERARKYTGIIKNKTKYEVSVPSGNSGATLVIPARGFIEYVSWTSRFDLTVYYDGKPFYCLKINANPRNYAFMCSKYDFMVEIVKEEPAPKAKKKVIRKKKKVAPKDEGVKAFG